MFGPVNADGTFTVSGIPSGTYALAFLGCDTGQPSATVHDPVDPARTYQAQWWHGVDLSLAGTTEGGPDPIAQHATLLAIGAGQELTGYDQCFGCQAVPPSPTPTPTTPTPTVPPTGPTPPVPPRASPLADHHDHRPQPQPRRAHTRLRRPPAAPAASQGLQLAGLGGAAVTFTAACTTTTGVTSTVQGASSPLTLTGVDDGATYSCVVAASSDGTPLGSSAAVMVGPLVPAQLPATGSDPRRVAWMAAVVGLRRRPARGRRRQAAPSGAFTDDA